MPDPQPSRRAAGICPEEGQAGRGRDAVGQGRGVLRPRGTGAQVLLPRCGVPVLYHGAGVLVRVCLAIFVGWQGGPARRHCPNDADAGGAEYILGVALLWE